MVGNGEIWFSGICKDDVNSTASGESVYDIINNGLPTSDVTSGASADICNYYLAIITFNN